MPEPADRPPSLRDRIADALHCPTCGVEPGAHCLRARVDNRQPHMTRVQAADAVMPVVEAETAALRQRAEEAERLAARYRLQVDDPDSLLVQLDQARDAIAAERKGRLAAEAAVRRGREMAEAAKRESVASFARRITGDPFPALLVADDILAALGAEQPEKPHGDMWTVAVQVPTRLPDAMKDGLFTAVADAVSEWEPADRDGWDPYVTGYTEQSKESP